MPILIDENITLDGEKMVAKNVVKTKFNVKNRVHSIEYKLCDSNIAITMLHLLFLKISDLTTAAIV